MQSIVSNRFGWTRRGALASAIVVGLAGVALLAPSDAQAQVSGTTNQPLPNVLLLVDTSGSMERMLNDKLPSDDPLTTCTPGTATPPNRWGTLLQALTGTFQPYYSCEAIDRKRGASTTRFAKEYGINGHDPYDYGYDLPHHRPLTGSSAATACVNMPYRLSGVGTGGGVGGGKLGDSGSSAFAWAADNIKALSNADVVGANGGSLSTATACTFSQAADGQLDAVQDFVRFGLMTFDPDPSNGTGVNSAPYSLSFGGTPNTGGANPSVTPPYANPFDGVWSYWPNAGAVTGAPTNCPTASPFEVGARHWAAPQWEGRHIPFANPTGTLLDIELTNSQIQTVLLGTRPWGATPIAGMLADAQDYLWVNDFGPYGTQTGYADPLVKFNALPAGGTCRDQFIILLTDGSPNLDLRPNCGSPIACPYQPSWQIADDLYNSKIKGTSVSRSRVQTFVIGFSVNGSTRTPNDGFPTTGLSGSYTPPGGANPLTCLKWFKDTGTNGGNGSAATMDTACTNNPPAKGSTAEACCELNKIAYYGSGKTAGAFFADSGVDIVTAFSRILGGIAKSATTRTAPGSAPSMNISNGTGSDSVAASYVAAFIPNARKVWSGEIDRQRFQCVGTDPQKVTQSQAQGDLYSVNVASQALVNQRRFLTAIPDPTGSSKTTVYPIGGISTSQPVLDSSATLRPFASGGGAGPDGVQNWSATEYFDLGTVLESSIPNLASAMNIDQTTCKKSQYVTASTAYTVPPLPFNECKTVIWDFTTAYQGSLNYSHGGNTFDFNLRCKNSGTNPATTGNCSISNAACSLDTATCPLAGEACVPACSALGAIFRSTPTVAGPPSGFLRDEGFRGFQAARANRRPVMYVASTDGMLHAFKALYDSSSNVTPGPTANYEMWSFIPPAVLPRLASNFPGGQQTILDGSPVVKDVVWSRTGGSLTGTSNLDDWHTTLVASLGVGGAGYYALNVSDPDCGGLANANDCKTAFSAATPGSSNLITASAGGTSSGGRQPGPHFLWQITDIEQGASDPAPVSRSNVPYASGAKTFVSLFGRQTGTPAITTLDMLDDSNAPIQVGVAILPGGIDGPPAVKSQDVVGNGACARAVSGFPSSFRLDNKDATAPPTGATANTRQWGTSCTAAVAGRGVTIVRLDNGQIIRHFGRKTVDVPKRIQNYTIDSPFDSPMSGTPVVFPASLGSAAQKIFIGDADGTVWRIDVSQPCHITPSLDSPACTWNAALFADIPAITGSSVTYKQPIVVAPVVSQSPTGSIVVNVATGDQENILASSDTNYVISLEETRPQGVTRLKWYRALTNGERVTGPMAVFDRSLYFSTYVPAPFASCASGGTAWLWGLDYFTPKTAGTPSAGGDYRWCPIASIQTNGPSGLCSVANVDKESAGVSSIIPGVSVTPSLACSTTGALSQDPGTGITGIAPTTYSINFNWSSKGSAPGGTGAAVAARGAVRASTPRYNASLDAWALVTD